VRVLLVLVWYIARVLDALIDGIIEKKEACEYLPVHVSLLVVEIRII
jgi:hypothetical protein